MELNEASEKLKKLDDEITKLVEEETVDPRVKFTYQIDKSYRVDSSGTKWYTVTLSISPKENFDLNNIEKVVYLLHPTFEPNVVTVDSKTNFSLKLESWGDFNAMAVIIFKDKSELKLVKYLPIGVDPIK